MKKLFKSLFNTNTGFFIREVLYTTGGRPYVGYVLCKGFKVFGISGYDRIDVFIDKSDALYFKKKLEEGEWTRI